MLKINTAGWAREFVSSADSTERAEKALGLQLIENLPQEWLGEVFGEGNFLGATQLSRGLASKEDHGSNRVLGGTGQQMETL